MGQWECVEIFLEAMGGGEDARTKKRWADMGDESTQYNLGWSVSTKKLWEYE